MKTILLILLGLNITWSAASQNLGGRILENDTWNTPLYGATVYIPELETGTVTNIQGYFTLSSVPSGTHIIRVSFIGYESQELSVTVPHEGELLIRLDKHITELDELIIRSVKPASPQFEQTRISTIQVSEFNLEKIPRLMGEPDLIRIIQNLPGVKTESDFTGGFHVRGGRNDQNLILLDGVPVYNPWHLFGLFSAFNTEALENVELTKGVFPAQYGGRVSSVLDIELQEGNERLGTGYLTVSPLSSSFSFGRPVNQKTSVLFAIRRTYMDPIFWVLSYAMTTEFDNTKIENRIRYSFMDLNLKVVHRFSSNLKLETALFNNHDTFFFETNETINLIPDPEVWVFGGDVGWRNTTISNRLSKNTPDLQWSAQLYYSGYRSRNELHDIQEFDYHNSITTSVDNPNDIPTHALASEDYRQGFNQQFSDLGLQYNLNYVLNEYIQLFGGSQLMLHHFRDQVYLSAEEYGIPFLPDGTLPNPRPAPTLMLRSITGDSLQTTALESALYTGMKIYAGPVSIFPGIRYEWYSKGNYQHILPRINVHFKLTPELRLSAGYGHFAQYMHILGIDMIRTPTDRWFWSDENRPPVFSRMGTLGFEYDAQKLGTIRVEGYHKSLENLINFSPILQAEAFVSEFLPRFGSETITGNGESYGVEFFWNKTSGAVSGWLGYTLSWAWNQFDTINNGQRYPSRTDKRHDIQLFVHYEISDNWSLGTLFNFKTGQPVTFTTAYYRPIEDPLDIGDRYFEKSNQQVLTETNSFRLPAYHRLDLNLTWHNRRLFRRKGEVSLNIINAYNRVNPLFASNNSRIEALHNQTLRITPKNKYQGQLPVLPILSMRIALGGDAR